MTLWYGNGLQGGDTTMRFAILSAVIILVGATVAVAGAFPGANGRIAFSSNRDGHFHVYSMNADGSDVVQLRSGAFDDRAPEWSPDGKLIAFSSNVTGDWDVYVMSAHGSG